VDHPDTGCDVAGDAFGLEPKVEIDIVEEKGESLVEEGTDGIDGVAPKRLKDAPACSISSTPPKLRSR